MGKKSWKDSADKRERGGFCAWPHSCATHESFYKLSMSAKALLFELLGQYRGNNNGDLCCAWGLLKNRGWKSRATIERACDELQNIGWIVRTRVGGRNRANLYALTFYTIDECKGKLDYRPMKGNPLGYWKTGENPEFKKIPKPRN
ncbi:MAG: hypothetical protein OEZ47_17300 [Gammaproteobacteria bacterium]|nr:hypothetical protein [Gammaproteobacteria bacterium]